MGIIGQIIYGLLSAVLPWLFSGKQTDHVKEVTGMKDMDRDTLSGAKLLPPLILCLFLSGCVYAGKKLTVNHVLVNAGGYLEIAQDEPILVKLTVGKDQVTELRNMAGAYAVPKSVYREFRADWVKTHPEITCGVEEEKTIVISAEPIATGEIMSKNQIQVFVLLGDQKKISKKVLLGWVAMPKSVYADLKNNWEKSHK
jgi:hypothetical protein